VKAEPLTDEQWQAIESEVPTGRPKPVDAPWAWTLYCACESFSRSLNWFQLFELLARRDRSVKAIVTL
jgi:hypothetical protein